MPARPRGNVSGDEYDASAVARRLMTRLATMFLAYFALGAVVAAAVALWPVVLAGALLLAALGAIMRPFRRRVVPHGGR